MDGMPRRHADHDVVQLEEGDVGIPWDKKRVFG